MAKHVYILPYNSNEGLQEFISILKKTISKDTCIGKSRLRAHIYKRSNKKAVFKLAIIDKKTGKPILKKRNVGPKKCVYLPYEFVIDMNEKAQSLFEEKGVYGTRGIKEENLLRSAVDGVKQIAFGKEFYPDILSKTAFLWYSLAKNHCFVNGNKRTALLAAIMFLRINCYDLDCAIGDTELYNISVKVARGDMDKYQLKKWLEDHVYYDLTVLANVLTFDE